jgi:NitT/TauT family transport system substrate-binding protein
MADFRNGESNQWVIDPIGANFRLGIGEGVPYIGYTFNYGWAEQNPALIGGFIAASHQARAMLAASDVEWQRVKPLTGAANDTELERLRDWYRRGIPRRWDEQERHAALQLFELLERAGGPELIGPISAVPPRTFWPDTWRTGA